MMPWFPSAARSTVTGSPLRTAAAGMLLIQAVWLVGCATPVDCGEAVSSAAIAGADDRWLAATLNQTPAACHAAATDAWLNAAAPSCSDRYAFAAARHQREAATSCGGDDFDSAADLGRMLGELERERAEIDLRLSAERLSAEDRRDLRQRQIVIGRDLPQLEALARMRGLIPPAEIPGGGSG